MVILKKSLNTHKDLEKIKTFSKIVEKKLAKINKKDEEKVEKLSLEELQDFNQILQLSDYLLCKYENKKEIHSLLKDFVQMINNSSTSIEILNDDIDELVISAEGAIKRIKAIQNNVSENFSFEKKNEIPKTKSDTVPENSGNNLTKSSTPVYTQEYQQKTTLKTEQVI